MNQLESLWVQYTDGEPLQVDINGNINVSKFIESVKGKFKPDLDSFSLRNLTLHYNDGTKLRGDIIISSLLGAADFINNYDKPLLIRYTFYFKNILLIF